MALIVEDGSGVDGAESLATVAAADTYHALRGNAAWTLLTEPKKEQLLRNAFDFMLGAYGPRWSTAYPFGVAVVGVANAVPARITQACALLALYANSGPLAPELKPQKIRSKTDVLESEWAVTTATTRRFPDVDRLVAPYLAAASRPYSVALERS